MDIKDKIMDNNYNNNYNKIKIIWEYIIHNLKVDINNITHNLLDKQNNK